MLRLVKALGTIEWWLHRAWNTKIVILAALFTGLETLVTMGIELPGSKAVPQGARALIYMGITGAAFYLRWRAQQFKKDQTPCPKCGQINTGQAGEYPCAVCGLPTLHDDPGTPHG